MKNYDFSHLTVAEMLADLVHLESMQITHTDYYKQLLKEYNNITGRL